MTAPNRSTLWGRTIISEVAAAGIDAVCVAPGSRSTPLVVAASDADVITVYSHLDERSAAYFALGRGRATGRPSPILTTSGTAVANLHPAVVEADEAGIPFLAVTADRPEELQDSGANQTVDQSHIFGDAVRWYHRLPEPAPESRRLRSVRVAIARAVGATQPPNPGPVHLNVPLPKPLDPTPVEGDIPADFPADDSVAAHGRDGPYVRRFSGRPTLKGADVSAIVSAIERGDRGLLVCGPARQPTPERDALAALAAATGWPVFADPLSGHRFGHDPASVPICGGYDSVLGATANWASPDVVVRFGAAPTSKRLRTVLRDSGARQFLVAPAGIWPEAEFAATDLVEADPDSLARMLAQRVDTEPNQEWRDRILAAEATHWETVEATTADTLFEGAILSAVASNSPAPVSLFVSNSMPVRDLDRFGRPRPGEITVHGNRGASGIDGITSTALGVASASDRPLVLVTGDLAYYHDMNGLLALDRCDVDATIVIVNNDGGGIFHMLPIEDHDPPFTDLFKTPHGLDFAPTGPLYGLDFTRVDTLDEFHATYESAVGNGEATVIEVRVDAERSHRIREELDERVHAALE